MKIDLENMTDVCGGKMTLKDLTREIQHYMFHKTPEKMVITIERNDDVKGLYSVIYIPIKDFKKPYTK